MVERLCTGCGAPLQTTAKDEPGYVPEAALERELPVCRRCFRITHYGEFSRNIVPDEEYERQVARIQEQPGVVLYVLDVFDLAGSMVQGLAKFVRDSRVILVVNKVDLLPIDVNYSHLAEWILRAVEKTGVDAQEVVFASAQSDIGIPLVIDAVREMESDVAYVVGMANVGKSSLLNRLLQHLRDGTKPVFTVSKVPGTTLGMTGFTVSLPDGERLRVIDTPGLIHGNRLGDVLCAQCLMQVVPSARLRPRVFQLNPGQTLFLGNAARFDFREGERQSVVCYVSNDLVVHRTKLEHADEFMALHQDDILVTPCPTCRAKMGQLRAKRITASPQFRASYPDSLHLRPIGADLTLPGLGWLTLSGKPIVADLWLPRNLRTVVRPRLIGQLNRSLER